MDIIAFDILLAFIRCVDVGFRVLNEVAPFDAADVRGFTPPNGRAIITDALVRRFAVKHIISDDRKSVATVICCTTAAATSLFL